MDLYVLCQNTVHRVYECKLIHQPNDEVISVYVL